MLPPRIFYLCFASNAPSGGNRQIYRHVDLLNRNDSGLAHAVAILEGLKGIAVMRFAAEDVVRHPLVERIVKAYDADSARQP